MTQKDDPEPPPPLVRVNTAPPDAEADTDRELQLWEAEEQSKKLQAVFVNRAFVKLEGRMLRITFGDRVGDEDVYRSAIMMTPEDAYELGQLLIAQGGGAFGVVLDHYRQILKDIDKAQEPNV